MKRILSAFLLCLMALPLSARAVQLTLDGQPLNTGDAPIYDNATYVPLRAVVEALRPQAQVSWEGGQAVVLWEEQTLTARPGEAFLLCNGLPIPLGLPVRLEEGRTLVPVRPLCELFDVQVVWHADIRVVSLHTSEAAAYSAEDLYWLSRIISAESRGEPWEGKLAVGHVVLNRVSHPEFPDTIYDVIFDERWGGQFEPVRNGTVYLDPTDESVRAAVACLCGSAENPVGDSLYFLAPALTDNHWTMENRDYVTTIGAHWFYR
ncbi:MAG: cell wall hydrolase [Oscillospiraceae bacterium]|nr:cell wall hydrolase [Oscillospiraceae bacterium]